VLIVDDSSIIRKLIEKHISKMDLVVIGSAENGKMALEIFQKELPDIVTLDLSMPEMDGLVVLQEMLKIKKDTKIIVVSAMTDKANGLRAVKLGARGFVAKPFTSEKLREALNNVD
jgi:two-component system chemotaxis response regulator CheY